MVTVIVMINKLEKGAICNTVSTVRFGYNEVKRIPIISRIRTNDMMFTLERSVSMSFMDKFKAGVAEAGSKAKTLVEINRIKLQNNGKKNEIEEQYQEIGRRVFDAAEEGNWPLPKEQLEPQINHILQLKWEIEQNLELIKNLTDEKTCKSCGNQVSINDRFCSKCGYTFEVIQEPIEVIEETSSGNEGVARITIDSQIKKDE